MKGYLLRNNITVKQFASDLGISTSYLYQLLRGERKPSLELAYRIEKHTEGEVTAGSLLSLDIQFSGLKEGQTTQDHLDELEARQERSSYRFSHLEDRVTRLERQVDVIEKQHLDQLAEKS